MHEDIDLTNFADGNMLYTSARNIEDVREGNANKCYFLGSSDEVSLNVDNFT